MGSRSRMMGKQFDSQTLIGPIQDAARKAFGLQVPDLSPRYSQEVSKKLDQRYSFDPPRMVNENDWYQISEIIGISEEALDGVTAFTFDGANEIILDEISSIIGAKLDISMNWKIIQKQKRGYTFGNKFVGALHPYCRDSDNSRTPYYEAFFTPINILENPAKHQAKLKQFLTGCKKYIDDHIRMLDPEIIQHLNWQPETSLFEKAAIIFVLTELENPSIKEEVAREFSTTGIQIPVGSLMYSSIMYLVGHGGLPGHGGYFDAEDGSVYSAMESVEDALKIKSKMNAVANGILVGSGIATGFWPLVVGGILRAGAFRGIQRWLERNIRRSKEHVRLHEVLHLLSTSFENGDEGKIKMGLYFLRFQKK